MNKKNSFSSNLTDYIRFSLDEYFSTRQGEVEFVNTLICVPTEINPLGDDEVERDAICRDLRDFLSTSCLEAELFSVQIQEDRTIAYQFQIFDPESMDSFDLELKRGEGKLKLLDVETNDWITDLDALSLEDHAYFSALLERHIEERRNRQ